MLPAWRTTRQQDDAKHMQLSASLAYSSSSSSSAAAAAAEASLTNSCSLYYVNVRQ